MIGLVTGYNAVRWISESALISSLDQVDLINRVYTLNPTTNFAGFIGYTKGDLFPTLTTLTTGTDYLINVSGPFTLNEGEPSPAGAFEAFDGYVPTTPTTPTTPVVAGSIPGTVNSQIAAVDIIGGTLVARVAAGLVPYSAQTTALRYLLFGFALNSALAGGTVRVQRNGYVTYVGLGLRPGATLFAGADGQLTYSHEGMALHHVVGRAETDDSFSFTSSYTTIKISD